MRVLLFRDLSRLPQTDSLLTSNMKGEEFHWLKQNEGAKKSISIVSDLKKALKDLEMHFIALNTG